MYFPVFALFAVVASAPASALSTDTAASPDLITMDFAASWNSAKRSPNKGTAQMCAMRSFHEAHENMHDLHYALEDVWVIPAADLHKKKMRALESPGTNKSMDFQGIVSSSNDEAASCGTLCDDSFIDQYFQNIIDNLDRQHHTPGGPIPTVNPSAEALSQHGGSMFTHVPCSLLLITIIHLSHIFLLESYLFNTGCGPKCEEEHQVLEEPAVLVVDSPPPVTVGILSSMYAYVKQHGGSCGPKCRPDDDELIEEVVEEVAEELQQHGGSCGPKCRPDDDELVKADPIVCAFCPPHGQVDASTLSHGDLVRLAAHMDWEESFCNCLDAEDPEAEIKGCSLVISTLM